MLFHEFFGVYYAAVAEIISSIIKDGSSFNERRLVEICNRTAFPASSQEIKQALLNHDWPLIKKTEAGFQTYIRNKPSFPLTTLEKRWLKAILTDPRIALFDIGEIKGLDDVDPLFKAEDYRLFDRCSDGDNYTDRSYINHFRMAIKAIREKKALDIHMQNRYGNPVHIQIAPLKMEYSEKDDKFRIAGVDLQTNKRTFVNVARIIECTLIEEIHKVDPSVLTLEYKVAVLEITDTNNALVRALTDFSHFERKVEQINDSLYRLHVNYDPLDETEMVIRILSFGPYIKALAPDTLVTEIKNRLAKQLDQWSFEH